MHPQKLRAIKTKLKTKVKTKIRALPSVKLPKLSVRQPGDRPPKIVAVDRTLDFFRRAQKLHKSAWGLHPALVTEQAYVQMLDCYLVLHKAFEDYVADGTFAACALEKRKEAPGTEKDSSERAEKLLGEVRAGVERVATFLDSQDSIC